jgi:Uma2 family endonuclease
VGDDQGAAGGHITLPDFLARPECDPPEEYRAGKIVPKPALLPQERWLGADLGTLLFGWVRASGQGAVAAATRCVIGGAVYVPDVAYFTPDHRPIGATGAIPAIVRAPDLVADVCPGAVDPAWYAERAAELLGRSVRQVWVIDAAAETVTVFTSGAEPTTLARDGVLEAPDLLPGFYVHLDDLFETLAEEERESV